jgi:hypothetical protein
MACGFVEVVVEGVGDLEYLLAGLISYNNVFLEDVLQCRITSFEVDFF